MTAASPSQLAVSEPRILKDPVIAQHPELPRRYGIPTFFQVSPTQVALLANRRVTNVAVVDHEDGWDTFIFDDLAQLNEAHAVSGLHDHYETHPVTGELLAMVYHLPIGGFIPLGAKLADGREHPHAGTGFGICGVVGHPADHSCPVPLHRGTPNHYYALLLQYKFDGKQLHIVDQQRLDINTPILGWYLAGRGLGPAIPDGEDLLFAMPGGIDDEHVAAYWQKMAALGRPGRPSQAGGLGTCRGVVMTRWRCGDQGWQIVEINRIVEPGPNVCGEPCIVRDADGALLVSVRSKGSDAEPGQRDQTGLENLYQAFRVYRSTDNGKTWQRHLCIPVVRSASPVTLNRLGDGNIYLAANPTLPLETDSHGRTVPMHSQRQRLWMWPLSADRRDVLEPLCVLDAPRQLGPPRPLQAHMADNRWMLDHALAFPVRLGDGQWHNFLAFRVTDSATNSGGASAAPASGLYAMTVAGQMSAPAPWRFAADA